MAKRVTQNVLNATTFDILNTIRANASPEYQSQIPKVTKYTDLPAVGETLYGNSGLSNQFLSALINRIALVRIKSATFNNPYSKLKKGYLEFGETVEEVFVNLAKAIEFNSDKAESREFKKALSDVRTAFHSMNWRVTYPVSVTADEFKQAFLSIDGVTDLISKIINSVYKAIEYDEFLLFKYLLIKAASHGRMFPVAFDSSDLKNAAKAFRGVSNKLTFLSEKYNESGVHTNTEKRNQAIFMPSDFNASYDVDVLASAFNMDKATFMGNLYLIDDFTEFDNARFAEIRRESTMIDEVTEEELTLMQGVKAILVDEEWFQVYDNLMKMNETFVSSGDYWNYFLINFKTVCSSPFSNAVVFVDDGTDIAPPATLTFTVASKDTADYATTFTLEPADEVVAGNRNYLFTQTEDATTKGIAIHKYGAVIFPAGQTTTTLELTIDGVKYTATTALNASSSAVGSSFTFNKEA